MKGVLIFKVPPAGRLKTPAGGNVHTRDARNVAVINLLPLDLKDVCRVIILVDEHRYYIYKNNITGVTDMHGIQTEFLPKFIRELEDADAGNLHY